MKESNDIGDIGAASTAMFIEVLVVGIGALYWVGLLTYIFAPNLAVEASRVPDPILVASTLSIAYVMGITTDRLCDRLMSRWSTRVREHFFKTQRQYVTARIRLAQIPFAAANYNYARSRIRVCRGWCLNTLLITASSDIFIATRSHLDNRLALLSFATVAGLALSISVTYSWYSIVLATYRSLHTQLASLSVDEGTERSARG